MAKTRKSPATEKADVYLSELVSLRKKSGNKMLPSIKEMARLADVSEVTMGKAVRRLTSQGRLVSIQRKGTAIIESSGASRESAQTETLQRSEKKPVMLWQKLKAEIERDILNNEYSPGTLLPSSKQLQIRYGVAFRTLQKALTALASQRILVMRGRSYAVAPLRTGKESLRVIMVGARTETGEAGYGFIAESYLRMLEIECTKARLQLQLAAYRQEGESFLFYESGSDKAFDIENTENVLGYIFALSGAGIVQDFDVEAAMRLLATKQKPVAVMSSVLGAPIPSLRRARQRFKVFPVAITADHASKTARYLLELGHKKIAYFSPEHYYPWSVFRFNQIAQAYSAAGYSEMAIPFVIDDTDYAQYLTDGRQHSRIDKLQKMYTTWARSVPAHFIQRADPFMQQIRQTSVPDGERFGRLTPLFERALADKSITCWVAANDQTATLALDFLHARNVSLPRDLSLVSFDDSLVAVVQRITSFNFNIPGIINAMLSHLLGRLSVKSRIVDIEGWIMERRTTGPAARAIAPRLHACASM